MVGPVDPPLKIWSFRGFASKDNLLRANHTPNAMEVHRSAQSFNPLTLVFSVGLVVLPRHTLPSLATGDMMCMYTIQYDNVW